MRMSWVRALYMTAICMARRAASSLFLKHEAKKVARLGASRSKKRRSGGARRLQAKRGGDADQHDNAAGFVGYANLPALRRAVKRERSDLAPDGAEIDQTYRFHLPAGAGRVGPLKMIEVHGDLFGRNATSAPRLH